MIVAEFAMSNMEFQFQVKLIPATIIFASFAPWNGSNTNLDAQFVARDSPMSVESLSLEFFLPLETLRSLSLTRSFSSL